MYKIRLKWPILLISLSFLVACGSSKPHKKKYAHKGKKGTSPWALPSGQRLKPLEECTSIEKDTESPFAYDRPWIVDQKEKLPKHKPAQTQSMTTSINLNINEQGDLKPSSLSDSQPVQELNRSKTETRFRYISRLYGGTSRVDSYCTNETDRDHYNQPNQSLLGRCRSKACGEANISARGSVEPAFFLAVLDHEVKRSSKVAESQKTYEEETSFGSETYKAYVQKERVNFGLDAKTKCSAQIKLYSDHQFRTYSHSQFHSKIKSLHINATPISGELMMTHTYNMSKSRYEVLLTLVLQVIDREERGQYEYMLLCINNKKPINILKSRYRFFVHRSKDKSEWIVQAKR